MIYEPILEELKSREVYLYDRYAPYYISSFACHVFNLHNQKSEVYYEAKEIPSLRMHILFVAPPGFMKSFYMKQFLQGKYAIFRNVGVPIGFENTLTEAGFVGTVKEIGGEIITIEGAAQLYSEGILGIDEFSAITKALQQQHSSQLDTQLLAALDHGNVYKRLGMGKIDFQTNLTLWAGVQPARFDLTSGLGRRFIYLVFFPTRAESDELLASWWKSKNKKPAQHEIEKLRVKIRKFKQDMSKVKKLEFSDDVLNEYRRLGLYPFEGTYFDRLLIGYHLAAYGPDYKITISTKDRELRKLINFELEWRRAVMLDAEMIQIAKMIESFGGRVRRSVLFDECTMLGLDIRKVSQILEGMRRYGLLLVHEDMLILRNSNHKDSRNHG
ncbi:MAG: hypothetical protein ACTSPB_03660 [Candidatus Thorarchaeota archaeon]